MMHIRLIPGLIILAILLLGVKVTDVMRGTEALAQQAEQPAEKKEIHERAMKIPLIWFFPWRAA